MVNKKFPVDSIANDRDEIKPKKVDSNPADEPQEAELLIESDESFLFDLDEEEIIKTLIQDHEQFGAYKNIGVTSSQTIHATEITKSFLKRNISVTSEPYTGVKSNNFTSPYIKPDPQTGVLPLSLVPKSKYVDIEDLGSFTDKTIVATKLNSKIEPSAETPFNVFRDGRLSVTDMTTKYCEVQSFYELCGLERVQSVQVDIGTEYHNQLEMAVEGIGEQIEVPEALINCEEDVRWLHFQGMYVMLRALIMSGATRELYVFAKLRGTLVTGIIDGLEIVDEKGQAVEQHILDHIKGWYKDKNSFYERESASGNFFANWYVKLADTKTRGRDSLPLKSQQLSAFHQLLLYHSLFSDLTNHAAVSPTIVLDLLVNDFSLELDIEVNPLILDLIYKTNGQIDYSSVNTIRKIMVNCLLPALGIFKGKAFNRLDVEYVYIAEQGGKAKPISTVSYSYSATELNKILDYRFGFWHGTREPEGASESEVNYKCPRCPFIEYCGWRAKKAEEATKRAKKRRTGIM